jgi:hypothetical protein
MSLQCRQVIEKTSRELEKLNASTAEKLSEQIFQELLSESFLQGIGYLDVQEKFELSNKLLQRVAFFPQPTTKGGGGRLDRVQVIYALTALIQQNKKELVQTSDAVAGNLLHATPREELVETLCDPPTTRVLGRIFPPECLDMFLHALEGDLQELLPEDADKKNFLTRFPVLTEDLTRSMTWLMDEWQKWLSLEETQRGGEDINQLIDSFSYLRDSPRIKLFYKHVTALKESFLTSLAVTLREVLRKDDANSLVHNVHNLRALAEELQLEYFYLPSGGVVMYRWLEKQILKYADLVISRAKFLASESVVLNADLKSRLTDLFAVEEVISVQLPFAADKKIVDFVNDHLDVLPSVSDVSVIPRGVLTLKAAQDVFALFPDLFLLQDSRASLLSKVDGSHGGAAGAAGGECLADILLREMLERIPRAVFMHKEPPVKRASGGVYRVGGREFVFVTKSGKLYVQMPNIDVDAAELLSREYGVLYQSLLPAQKSLNRAIDYTDARFLYRIIRAGFKAKDEYWKNLWKQYMEHEKIAKEKRHPKQQNNLKVLAKFVERNVSYVTRKDWSRRFLILSSTASAGGEGGESSTHLHADSGSEEEQTDKTLPAHLVASEDNPFYKTRKCIAFQAGKCTRGDKCTYAHSDAELRQGPAFVPPPPQPTNHFARLAPTQEMIEEKLKLSGKQKSHDSISDILPPVNFQTQANTARTRSRSPRMSRVNPPAPATKKKLIDDDDL